MSGTNAEGGRLRLVATPIGNLGDFSIRAVAGLQSATLIACEDTRRTARLLDHHGLHVPMVDLTEHNEARRIPELLEKIAAGQIIALVSDAGFPTISDPGQRLVHAAIGAGVFVEVLPGPSAVLTALAGSGLPTVPFYFGGFLPHKKGQRDKELAAGMARDCTSVYFESPYRIVDSLGMIAARQPAHHVVVARELTKMFEEFQRGPAQSVLEHFQSHTPKGEITLIIAPHELPNWMTRGSQAEL
ncbi:MAG TPA: 16S rRNA (cytidine(1402)-2'-O)-methyltransferase [Verrucomicrobiaceae bacterium]